MGLWRDNSLCLEKTNTVVMVVWAATVSSVQIRADSRGSGLGTFAVGFYTQSANPAPQTRSRLMSLPAGNSPARSTSSTWETFETRSLESLLPALSRLASGLALSLVKVRLCSSLNLERGPGGGPRGTQYSVLRTFRQGCFLGSSFRKVLVRFHQPLLLQLYVMCV